MLARKLSYCFRFSNIVFTISYFYAQNYSLNLNSEYDIVLNQHLRLHVVIQMILTHILRKFSHRPIGI